MNYFEIKKSEGEFDIPFTYESIIFKNRILYITIKVHYSCNKIEFIEEDPPNKYYKVKAPNNIEIINPLGLTNDNKHTKLEYYFKNEGNGTKKEFILKFETNIDYLKPIDGFYKLKFKGVNKKIQPENVKTEEGIIIFEPPTKHKHRENQ